jgi:hypothetical protein
MRSITFSLLLLISTQTFGIFRQVSRAGEILHSTLRQRLTSKRPLEALAAFHARGFATNKKETEPQQARLRNQIETLKEEKRNANLATVLLGGGGVGGISLLGLGSSMPNTHGTFVVALCAATAVGITAHQANKEYNSEINDLNKKLQEFESENEK